MTAAAAKVIDLMDELRKSLRAASAAGNGAAEYRKDAGAPGGADTPAPQQSTAAVVTEQDIERDYVALGWLTERAFNVEAEDRCDDCRGQGWLPDGTLPVPAKEACLTCDSTGVRKVKCRVCDTPLGFADEVGERGEFCSADCAQVDRMEVWAD